MKLFPLCQKGPTVFQNDGFFFMMVVSCNNYVCKPPIILYRQKDKGFSLSRLTFTPLHFHLTRQVQCDRFDLHGFFCM